MAYQIFTDSCCDLQQAYALEHALGVIPMSFRIDDQEYLDDYGASLPYHDFYEKLRAGGWSTTAQINSEEFAAWFTPVLERGEDILYLAFSSALSGTYQSALIAKADLEQRYAGRRVVVVDTLCASMGQGLLVHYALGNRDKGMDLEQNADWLEQNKGNLCHWFTVYDLNHLKRGGRVSAAAAFFGTMLSIKPVLHVDDKGRLIAMEKAKGRTRSVRALFEHMKETAIMPQDQTVFISHGDSENDAKQLADMIREQWGITDIRINFIGPVIGTHSGPDTIALFFMGTKR